mgnify:CR=1 FL=1
MFSSVYRIYKKPSSSVNFLNDSFRSEFETSKLLPSLTNRYRPCSLLRFNFLLTMVCTSLIVKFWGIRNLKNIISGMWYLLWVTQIVKSGTPEIFFYNNRQLCRIFLSSFFTPLHPLFKWIGPLEHKLLLWKIDEAAITLLFNFFKWSWLRDFQEFFVLLVSIIL